jgi:hypothetical protein
MPRKRFNAEEKALIALGPGTPVEWQNVTQWHPGTLTDGIITTDSDGWQWVRIDNHAATRTVTPSLYPVSPGHIRERRGNAP